MILVNSTVYGVRVIGSFPQFLKKLNSKLKDTL